ncbi:5788_t:CDS:2 [Paraglomus occultum]|uniref:5788_t:CDS:1 n=1 Tax=Paraglomus occultum TaxID=144539 RepID=A0A9N9D498_9GLOM|nr:5788_t:CDS:2 [Paraglomus occultum]
MFQVAAQMTVLLPFNINPSTLTPIFTNVSSNSSAPVLAIPATPDERSLLLPLLHLQTLSPSLRHFQKSSTLLRSGTRNIGGKNEIEQPDGMINGSGEEKDEKLENMKTLQGLHEKE